MLSLAPNARIWVCTTPADMRKSFDGLCGLIRTGLGSDPLSGELFVFGNRTGDRVKILHFEGDGLAIYYKRLEAGRFHFPTAADGSPVTLRAADLLMLLDGVDLASVRRRRRYHRPQPEPA
jgi:transposase